MKNYELLYIVSNQYTEEELPAIREKVNELIVKRGGVVGYQENLGKRKLAYPIKKVAHGYYVITEFELEEGKNLETINTDLRLDKEIVRAQIVVKPKITAQEIEKMKQRAEAVQVEPEEAKTKPTAAAKKAKTKNLDEKLDEILKDDNIL